MLELLTTLPNFILYFITSIILTAMFLGIYTKITPYDEFALIKQGFIAPAISLSGSLLGFVIALAAVIKHSISLIDMLIWGVIALVVQLLAFGMTRLIFKDLTPGIVNNNLAKAIILAVISLSFGVLNASCMTY